MAEMRVVMRVDWRADYWESLKAVGSELMMAETMGSNLVGWKA